MQSLPRNRLEKEKTYSPWIPGGVGRLFVRQTQRPMLSCLAPMLRNFLYSFAILALLAGCAGPSSIIQTTSHGVVASAPIPAGAAETHFVARQSYKGWSDAFLLSNGRVWAAVVPSLGRVMQFGRVNDEGVFWENPLLIGKPMPDKPWDLMGSFGGDKTWPAPQSAWNWPPPDVFDREPVKARQEQGALILESRVSPRFGIRTERRIELEPGRPVMRITTTYHKVEGEPVEVGVWVITQARNPVAVYLPIPPGSIFPEGYSQQWGTPTNVIQHQANQIRLTRDRVENHKIGNDADRIVWQGPKYQLIIESPRIAGAVYPDGGCSMEVYTNGGAADYVELETLGPLKRLSVGETLTAVNVYRVDPR